jgi:hypothetical protein
MASLATNDQKRSLVHNYFTRLNLDSVVCNLCKTTIKAAHSNTSNLRQHLQVKHRSEHTELCEKEKAKKAKIEKVSEINHLLFFI